MKSTGSAKTYIVCLLALILFSCKKEKNYHIHGRLVSDCSGQQPVAHAKIMLIDNALSPCTPVLRKEAVTNSNGEFIFEYELSDGACTDIELNIINDQKQGVVFGIPANRDMELADITYENNFNYDMLITSSVTYTPLDTLFYDIQYKGNDSTYQYVVGPFPAKIRAKFSGPYSLNRKYKHFAQITCLLKTVGTSNWYGNAILPFYLYPPCGPEYQTVLINLP